MADILKCFHACISHPWRKVSCPLGHLPHAVPVLGFGEGAPWSRAVARTNHEQNRFIDQRQSCTTGWLHIA